MADAKITELVEDTAPAAGDWLVTVDVSDTSMGPGGTDKKIQAANLAGALGLGSAATHAASDFLAPTGSGAALTGITAAQVGLGNVANAAQLVAANNLSDLASAAAARTNLGLAASATTDTTNASNITSGTLPSARLTPFVASGASHAQGAVPDPGATAGTSRYLREDATWAPPPAASVAVGSTITGATAGSLIFAGAGGVVAQDNANLFYDFANHRLGIGTATPSVALEVAGGLIKGGTYSATQPVTLDLSNNSSIGYTAFKYPNNGQFTVVETGVIGTNDVFFQAFPGTTAGYGYLEAYNAAGMCVGTGNGNPVLIRPNRTTTATFALSGATLELVSPNPADLTLRLKGASSQSGDFLNCLTYGNAVVSKIDRNGAITCGTSATAGRPTVSSVGTMWYDTTLNKPIWWDGSAWRDATGAAV